MTKKLAETRFVDLARYYKWYTHKYGDARYCTNCNTLLPKTERTPDYYSGVRGTWIEAKNTDATGRWAWAADIGPEGARKIQRKWMKKENGWLFIVLSDGQAPKHEDAYLIPWYIWLNEIEPFLIVEDQKTLIRTRTSRSRILPADELLFKYKLEWEPSSKTNKKGNWIIPKDHLWWQLFYKITMCDVKKIEKNLSQKMINTIKEELNVK